MTRTTGPPSGSAWSATPSWAPPTRRPGAPPAASSTCRSRPTMTVLVRPRRRPAVAEAAERLGWASARDRLAPAGRARRRRPRRHLHARRHPRRDRHRRARGRQARAVREAAGQHRRRGRGDGRGRRAGRARAASGRWSASPTAGCRPSRWPASSSPRAGSARSGTCARSTCRTGSPTRPPRCRGGCRRRRPARARSATSARTSST